MKILLRAPLLTNSGYGVHSRQIFEWLSEKKGIDLTVECLRWGMTPWLLNENYENGLVKKIMSFSKKVEPKYDITIQNQLPNEWDTSLGHKNIGVSAFVETDKCNPKWIDCCNKMDLIIVPSEFTKKVIKRSGVCMTNILVIPEWFNQHLSTKKSFNFKKSKDERFNFKTKFNFLIISQLTASSPEGDRKNIYNCIKWTLENFKNNKDVGVIIKTSIGKGTQADRALTKESIEKMIKSFNINDRPPVYLIHGNMSSKEVANLYQHNRIKCILSPTRGEGYGLPLIDAAAAEMPVIATNWSGHLQFLKNENYFTPVDYDLKEIPKLKVDNSIFLEGQKWAEPLEKSFKDGLNYVYKNYNAVKRKSEKLSIETIENFNSSKIKKMYDDALGMI